VEFICPSFWNSAAVESCVRRMATQTGSGEGSGDNEGAHSVLHPPTGCLGAPIGLKRAHGDDNPSMTMADIDTSERKRGS